jgi:hypothetical protein
MFGFGVLLMAFNMTSLKSWNLSVPTVVCLAGVALSCGLFIFSTALAAAGGGRR